jgi:hypothetical protein
MDISKQLIIGLIIGFLIGASSLYAITQYSSITNGIAAQDSKISDLQTQITNLQNQINQLERESPQPTAQSPNPSVTASPVDLSPLQIILTASPQNVNNGNTTSITAFVTVKGISILGATFLFTSNNGGSFAQTTEQGNGYYKTIFTAPSFSTTTNCIITVNAMKTGYLSTQSTTLIIVTPAATATLSPSPNPSNISPSLILK